METAVQSYKILTLIGKSPFADNDKKTVGGEETDGAITKFNLGIIGAVAFLAIASAREYTSDWFCKIPVGVFGYATWKCEHDITHQHTFTDCCR
jgi:hypothetical protein